MSNLCTVGACIYKPYVDEQSKSNTILCLQYYRLSTCAGCQMCICKQFHSKQGHLERVIISPQHSIPRFLKKNHIDVINLEKTTPGLTCTCLHFRVLPRHLGRASLAISLHHIFAVTRESNTRKSDETETAEIKPSCSPIRVPTIGTDLIRNEKKKKLK